MKLYTLLFADGTKYEGGNIQETKWKEIPNKPIKSIFYMLPTGDFLTLTNFKRIYHYVEVTCDLNARTKQPITHQSLNLLIERENKIISYTIDLQKVSVDIKVYDLEDAWIKKLNPIGWKRGL